MFACGANVLALQIGWKKVRDCRPRIIPWAERVKTAVLRLTLRTAASAAVSALLLGFAGGMRPVQAQTVQAVLFFSPTCDHCHQIITQYLPVLFDEYGGMPTVTTDESVPERQRSLYLFHNDRLEILLVDASKPDGSRLYRSSTVNQDIPPQRSGVPRLVIGDEWLVGSLEIPERTGELVRKGLAEGGIGWPDVDGLTEAVASIPGLGPTVAAEEVDSAGETAGEAEDTAATEAQGAAGEDTARSDEVAPDTALEAPQDTTPPAAPDTAPETEVDTAVQSEEPGQMPAEDSDTAGRRRSEAPSPGEERESGVGPEPAADSAAPRVQQPRDTTEAQPSVFEMIRPERLSMLENFRLDPVGNSFSVVILLFMMASVIALLFKPQLVPSAWGLSFAIPVLTVIGAVVASYLAYIEVTGTLAVCGPLGDCNTVNQSEYAKLFGVLPIGLLGLFGYAAISAAWVVSRYVSSSIAAWARLSLLVMTLGGTLFSIYLTFLEPFVIGATCAWCLTSSVIMTLLLWLVSGTGREAWQRIRGHESSA